LEPDYLDVTEIAGNEVSTEQIQRLCNRYYWAGSYCSGKDVVEAACGTGQGVGYLSRLARTFDAGDYSEEILNIARRHYDDRVRLHRFDAMDLPFDRCSKDVIILFEAIYYLPDAEKFIKECARVLRPGGQLLIATANKDLYDFNPSPQSFAYYGVVELNEMLSKSNFSPDFFGDTPVDKVSFRQKMLRPVKKMVVTSGLMPKSMAGKKLLKKLVFGNLVIMPAEIDAETSVFVEPSLIPSDRPDYGHKVILCAATLQPETE